MNVPSRSYFANDDDARFDRLVDGELSPAEYQAIVASLDDEPGGWRRCGLAFLEAQALGRELTALRRERSGGPALKPAAAGSAAGGPARWKQWLAMAASFLVALSLGIALPSLWRAVTLPHRAAPSLAGDQQAPQQPQAIPAREPPREVASARLVVSGPGGPSAAGDVPIYELSGDAGKWLGQQGSALPVTVVNELVRRGHAVERQQQYVPVDLGDGRRGVIPVETIQITPVGRRAY